MGRGTRIMDVERKLRKVNFDGTDAPVKIRLLKNERKGKIKFTSTDEDGNQYQW